MRLDLQPGRLVIVFTDSPTGRQFELRTVARVDDRGLFVEGRGRRYYSSHLVAATPATEAEGEKIMAQLSVADAKYQDDRQALRKALDAKQDAILAGQPAS